MFGYTDHEFVSCTIDLDRLYWQDLCYWKAIRVESDRVSKALAVERNRIERGLVNKLDEALRTGVATEVLATRLAFDQFSTPNTKTALSKLRD